jgi:hypothetical protein
MQLGICVAVRQEGKETFFSGESSALSANGGDACGCRIPFGGAVVVILPVLWLRVKILDLAVSTAAALCVVTLLEPRFHSVFFVSVVFVFVICFVRGSPLHLVSVQPLIAI